MPNRKKEVDQPSGKITLKPFMKLRSYVFDRFLNVNLCIFMFQSLSIIDLRKCACPFQVLVG